ncbi:MAG TPA: glycosyltransferase family 39 protein [Methanobacterium sp.]|nr:glycosyltransferase family 39 protein [Methanobacterium sp.]
MLEMSTKIKQKSWMIILIAIFIFSFILDLYVLTRYNLSYGRDGPFYDLQVLSILQTGFPASNDPPLVYYLLTPFVMLSGNSFIGIKIGMALMGSLMAFPAYFLTEIFSEKLKVESKIPALLSAFLITINPFYFSMIGDFMQNLVGVFFLLLLVYFAVKWFENTKEWKKYGILTVILIICSIFTHIYTGILAVVLFVSLLLFSMIFRTYKTGKIPGRDLKIVGIVGVLIIGGLVALFALYPVAFSKFTTVLSFVNNSSSTTSNLIGGPSTSPLIFLTVPFILGILATLNVLYKGLKEKIDAQNEGINQKTLLVLVYLVMTVVIIAISTFPSIDSQYQSRFIMLAFVPIALMVPLGLKLIEKWISNRYPSKKGLKWGIVSIIAVLFMLSSFYSASATFSSLQPSITIDQYNDLVKIKAEISNGTIKSNGIIVVNDYHTGYWVQYVTGMHVETGNSTSEIQAKYPNQTIYALTLTENQQSGLKNSFESSWNPLFPYSFPLFGLNITSNQNGPGNQNAPGNMPDQISRNNMTVPPSGGLGNKQFNRSSSTPPNFGNMTQNMNTGSSMPNQSSNQLITSSGKLIYSSNNLKIYKIS